ncbi:TonB-dependent receptor [Inquilinus limosus]|uniref:TonB-dependent receptor n=1 Tax=Inquilinus limosus TaxID=171674 RepID=UPI00041171E8|nr:TonB-dependent receptor [Inquilinus limosus]
MPVFRRAPVRCGGVPLLALVSLPALLTPAEAPAQDDTLVLEPIVVTARKREEDLQQVPISATVLEGDRLDISPIASNADLARSVPNFSFVDVGGQSSNFGNIRGIGSFSPVSGDDTSVVFYVDEMPQSVFGVAPNLVDVDQVAVLRGPQGTLFGRNSQGGAVSIVPRRPALDREFSLTGEIGTDGYALGQMVANGALVPDRLAGRLALSWSHFGGDIPNLAAGGDDGGLDIGAARGALRFTPDDRSEALLTFSYGRDDTHSPRFLLRDTPDFPVSETDPRNHVDTETTGVSLRIRHEFEGFAFTSLTGAQRDRSSQRMDLTDGLVFARMTGLPSSVFDVPGADIADIDFDQTSILQEFRLTSLPDSAVAWTAGVNFYRSAFSSDRNGRAVTPAFLSVNGAQANDVVTNSYAVFGEVTVPVADRLKATFGLRATHEHKSATYRFDGDGLPGVVPSFGDEQDLDDNFLTGRAALSYDWTPGLMTYTSISRGYVSAGFPAIAVNSGLGRPEDAFPASESWTYEVGFKSTLFGDRLRLDGALFYNDVRNGHLVVFDAAQALFTTTALDYSSYGGEIELTARLAPDLDLFGGVGATHAELGRVPAGSLTGARSGGDVPNVPALTANLGIEYRWATDSVGLPGDLVGRLTYQHVGARAADVANTFDLSAYDIVNARLSWEGDGLRLYAFATNLTDERYESWGQSFGGIPTMRVGQGRVVGGGVSVEF